MRRRPQEGKDGNLVIVSTQNRPSMVFLWEAEQGEIDSKCRSSDVRKRFYGGGICFRLCTAHMLGRRPVLNGHSAVGVLTVPIALVLHWRWRAL